ncbi:MAG: class I SAM-dependent methyltransferase [Balneolaceae bacterium]
MNVRQAYNRWAAQYDSDQNKTRYLEAVSLKENVNGLNFGTCLEIGCGTGKNTGWLLTKSKRVVAADLSEEMLSKAKEKIVSDDVIFVQSDINEPWDFGREKFDLITFSLVLEHIKNLDHVFEEASKTAAKSGYVYVGELHPFKQYSGSKARFETEEGLNTVPCFTHHISDFTRSAKKYGLEIVHLDEFFDDDGDKSTMPRILSILFKKSG